MSNYYNYATLGNSCQTNLDVLVDSRKFLSMDDLVYNKLYTSMKRYPLYSTTKEQDVMSDDERIYLGKDGDEKEDKKEDEKSSPPENYSCCGRR